MAVHHIEMEPIDQVRNALHLGAHKILAVSPRYNRSAAEGKRPEIIGYPPPIQVLGVLYNAVFLDLIDQDVHRMERMNRMLRKLPPAARDGMRVVELLVVRPSRDLGRLALLTHADDPAFGGRCGVGAILRSG